MAAFVRGDQEINGKILFNLFVILCSFILIEGRKREFYKYPPA
jgi:hypothetical protein